LRRPWLILLLALWLLPAPGSAAVARKKGLRIYNRTPYILTVYVAGVRAGWIKPFRTAVFNGLKGGYHRVYVASHYGSASWGPRRQLVPGSWSLTPPANTKSSEDLEISVASRLYRQHRSALTACDRLAERRGEDLRGLRASFEVSVDADGRGVVKVNGESMSSRLLSCYGAVARTWEYPAVGSPYSVSFQHVL